MKLGVWKTTAIQKHFALLLTLLALNACATPRAQLHIIFTEGNRVDALSIVELFESTGVECVSGTRISTLYICQPDEPEHPQFSFDTTTDPFLVRMDVGIVYFPLFQDAKFNAKMLARLDPIIHGLRELGATKLTLYPFRTDIDAPIEFDLDAFSIDQLNP